MKNGWTSLSVLLALLVAVAGVAPALADVVGNEIQVQLVHEYSYFTDADSLSNTPLQWSNRWRTAIYNPIGAPDSPLLNPNVQWRTKLNLSGFMPPNYITAQPDLGLYTWNFAGVSVQDTAMLSASAEESLITATPRFSGSRTVAPATLSSTTTTQTVTFNFRLEEALPAEVNQVGISIGSPLMAFGNAPLVNSRFVSQTAVADWYGSTDGTRASWGTHPSRLSVGKTYTFQATLESVKSNALLGSPVYTPRVDILYSYSRQLPMVTANSVAISDPRNLLSSTISADNVVDWRPGFEDSRYTVMFRPVVSQVTPPPAPYHVLVPAQVRVEPETVQLKRQGVVTAFVQLPSQYDVKDVDVSTVTLQQAPAISGVVANGTLLLKFKSADLQHVSPGENVILKLQGLLRDGSMIRGEDTVRVLP